MSSMPRIVCFLLAIVAGNALIAAGGDLPGGSMPILLVVDQEYAGNPFGSYLAEILHGEGMTEFETVERAALADASDPGALLAAYDVVLMAEMDLNPTEEQVFRRYVQCGGKLVANRPDADMADVFGINVLGTRAEQVQQYYAVDTTMAVGRGFGSAALQYHGEATNYALAGATPLAYLRDEPDTPSSDPAVTIHDYGSGQAVAFAFSLDKSVVLTRQGNPDWKDTEGDGVIQYRPMDMFMRLDGTKYVDLDRMNIPQADEQQRFLANILTELPDRPLPRMWYLPGEHKTLMVNTGDGEGNYGSQFDPVLNTSASYGGNFTLYLREIGINNTTVQQEASWRAAGHETGVHMYANGAEGAGAYDALQQAFRQITASLENKFQHGSRTARNHTIDWTGWVDMAEIEADCGTRMDMNYYHYFRTASPLTTHGYFNGTGLPQRLVKEDGTVLPIYQATTLWTDEWFADNGLTAQQAIQIMVDMFEASRNGYYSAFVSNIHPVRYNGSDITSEWAQAIWAYCQAEGIPMWSGEQLLDFVEARDAARFDNLDWSVAPEEGTRSLSFDFSTTDAGQELTVMIPRRWKDRTLKGVAAEGQPIDWWVDVVKGVEYGMFTLESAQAGILASYGIDWTDADLDGDGFIGSSDLDIVRSYWGQTVMPGYLSEGDPSGDGFVGGDDLDRIRAYWGEGTPPASVPEPSGAAGLIGLLLAAFRKRSALRG